MNTTHISLIRRVLMTSMLIGIIYTAQAQSSQELKKQQQAIEKEIAKIQQMLKENEKAKKNTLNTLNLLNRKHTLRNRLIKAINGDIRMSNQKIKNRNTLVQQDQEKLQELKKQYAQSVRNTYIKNRNASSWKYLLSSNSMSSSVRSLHHFKNYQKALKQQAENIKQHSVALEQNIHTLEQQLNKQEKDLTWRSQEISKIKKERKQKGKVVSQLSRKGTSLQKKIKSKFAKQRELKKLIQRAIKREIEAARKRKAKAAPSASEKTEDMLVKDMQSKFLVKKGGMTWPVDGVILSSFGDDIFQGHNVSGKNIGTSFRGKVGSNVMSIADGIVSSSLLLQGIYTVIIKHGNYFSGYSNLASISVKRGDVVKPGQAIGTIAKSEDGSWGELVLQIANLKGNVDPEIWLKATR